MGLDMYLTCNDEEFCSKYKEDGLPCVVVIGVQTKGIRAGPPASALNGLWAVQSRSQKGGDDKEVGWDWLYKRSFARNHLAPLKRRMAG